LDFINRFLTSKESFESIIDDIINNRVSLLGDEKNLSSDNLFKFIKSKNTDGKTIYKDIINSVFNAEINQSLELWILDKSQGEIALKVSNSNAYFGLIYIGDTNSFKRNIEASGNFSIMEDKFTNSLFNSVNDEESEIKNPFRF